MINNLMKLLLFYFIILHSKISIEKRLLTNNFQQNVNIPIQQLDYLRNNLFINLSNPTCDKAKYKINYDKTKEPIKFGNNTYLNIPKKRHNLYSDENIGFGDSSYLFDYLDELLLSPMLRAFNEIELEIKKLPLEHKDFNDAYSLLKMLNINLNQNSILIPEFDLINKLNMIIPNGIDMNLWKTSFNSVQINLMIKNNNWAININEKDQAKALIDNFDFNGDGRLSIDELIIATIDSNKSIYGQGKCHFCLENIAHNIIDPIFEYINCKKTGFVSAEEIWNELQFLNRNGSTLYDIYKCKYQDTFLRTNAINDFVIKSSKLKEGYLTKEEFRLGVLVGYWNRQTNYGTIIYNNVKSKKESRWFDSNGIDRNCGV